MLEACLLPSFGQLFLCIFDSLAAYGALRILEELKLPAEFVPAAYHQRLPACVAFLAGSECLPLTERTYRHQCPSAAGARGVAAFNGLQAVRAMVSERTPASAFGTDPAVPFDHLPAVDAWLFVCGHIYSLVTLSAIAFVGMHPIFSRQSRRVV
jgi:hypothetical protein